MKADKHQMPPPIERRGFLMRLLAAVAIGSQPISVLAQKTPNPAQNPLFQDRPEDMSGPLGQFADELSTRANSLGKKGRYPQELFERFEKGDTRARLELYKLSEGGDANARTIIGWMFDNGVGAARNSEKAAELFMLASVSDSLAHYNLGVLYLQGRGVQQSTEKAMEHFGQTKRIPAAFVQLSHYALSQKMGNAAVHFAEKAARQRDPAGMYLYGRLLIEKGEYRVGAQNTQRAARANYPEAITAMAVLHRDGIGLQKDAGMAAGWWVIDNVMNKGQTLDSSEKSVERLTLTSQEKAKAIRFARKWLMNREPMEAFDYTKTLNFSDVPRL